MKKVTMYNLTLDEIEEVEFICQLISDRQDRPYYIHKGKKYIEPYGYNRRLDMYWIGCRLGKIDLGSLCVDPSFYNPKNFRISRNRNKIQQGYNEVVSRAKEWFKLRLEYQLQIKWINQLKEKIIKDCEEEFTEPKLGRFIKWILQKLWGRN